MSIIFHKLADIKDDPWSSGKSIKDFDNYIEIEINDRRHFKKYRFVLSWIDGKFMNFIIIESKITWTHNRDLKRSKKKISFITFNCVSAYEPGHLNSMIFQILSWWTRCWPTKSITIFILSEANFIHLSFLRLFWGFEKKKKISKVFPQEQFANCFYVFKTWLRLKKGYRIFEKLRELFSEGNCDMLTRKLFEIFERCLLGVKKLSRIWFEI